MKERTGAPRGVTTSKNPDLRGTYQRIKSNRTRNEFGSVSLLSSDKSVSHDPYLRGRPSRNSVLTESLAILLPPFRHNSTSPNPFFLDPLLLQAATMGITRTSRHKRRATGGQQSSYRKKRKFEMVRRIARDGGEDSSSWIGSITGSTAVYDQAWS